MAQYNDTSRDSSAVEGSSRFDNLTKPETLDRQMGEDNQVKVDPTLRGFPLHYSEPTPKLENRNNFVNSVPDAATSVKTSGSYSKALGKNPKDLLGEKKISLTKLPAVAVAHGAHAMMDGARKYGPYNWRSNAVIAHIYIDAAKRHLDSWFEGEEVAQDSGVHHLGHAIACCAILLDALETGNLIDDRPDGQNIMAQVLERLAKVLQQKQAERDLNAQGQGIKSSDSSSCNSGDSIGKIRREV